MGNSAEKFLLHLRREKRYSSHTLNAYENDLRQLAGYLKTHYGFDDLLEASPASLRSWLADMSDKDLGRPTINRKLSSLKSFFKYSARHGLLDKNPADYLRSVRRQQRLPEFVSADRIRLLFAGPDIFEDGFPGIRDRYMLEMLYCTGMRLSELTGLKHSDVDEFNAQLRVSGKGNKQRLVPMIPGLLSIHRSYCSAKQRQFGCEPSGPVFVTDKGKPVYSVFVFRRVKRYLGMVSTQTRKSPHVLRHTFATHMLNEGADLNAIKEILGHASLAATQVYTHNTIEKIKTIYKQAHPKA